MTHDLPDDAPTRGSCGSPDCLGREARTLKRALEDAHQQLTDVVNQYVTVLRLFEHANRAAILGVMEEVVISIVGSECFGYFECVAGEVREISSFGLSQERVDFVREGWSRLLRASSGASVVTDLDSTTPEVGTITAVVPLRDGSVDVGLLVVFEMLAHKGRLTASDVDLLEVLGQQASRALRRVDTRPSGRTEAVVDDAPTNAPCGQATPVPPITESPR